MADEVKQAPLGGVTGIAVSEVSDQQHNIITDTKNNKHHKNDGPKDEQGRPVMQLKVYSPFKNYFDDYAYSITASNHTGPFDILPRHHNFMTLVDPCDMVVTAPSGDKTIRINRAVMHVKSDKIVVFLDA